MYATFFVLVLFLSLVPFLFPVNKQDTTNCWKQENLCALGTSQIAFKVTNVADSTVISVGFGMGMGMGMGEIDQKTKPTNTC